MGELRHEWVYVNRPESERKKRKKREEDNSRHIHEDEDFSYAGVYEPQWCLVSMRLQDNNWVILVLLSTLGLPDAPGQLPSGWVSEDIGQTDRPGQFQLVVDSFHDGHQVHGRRGGDKQ